MSTKVTFNTETITEDGKKHAADKTANVPDAEARELVYTNRARLADTKSEADSQQGDEADPSGGTA